MHKIERKKKVLETNMGITNDHIHKIVLYFFKKKS